MSENSGYKESTIKKKIINNLLILQEWIWKRGLIFSILIILTSGGYSIILGFLGEYLHLIEYDNNTQKTSLTVLGIICTILFFLLSFFVEWTNWYYKKNKENSYVQSYMTAEVSERISKVCTCKYNTLITSIACMDEERELAGNLINKPCEQLKTITNQIEECLKSMLKYHGFCLENKNLSISIYYKFHNEKKWYKTENQFPGSGLNVDKLMRDCSTTYASVLSHKDSYIFYNNKAEAEHYQQYVKENRDVYDKDGKLNGSILCYRIKCTEDGKDYITAILSINTYGCKMVPDDDNILVEKVRDDIIQYIIEPFLIRIRIELCQLFALGLNKKNESNNIQNLSNVHK